jgi:hypothetical protein
MSACLRFAALGALLVLALLPAAAAADAGGLRHFGYFAARLTPSGGDHLAEVAGRSNLNWVQISDVDRYRPELLDGCKPAGCIISTGHEFFTGCDKAGSTTCRLYPNYRERWLRLASAVDSRLGKVGAFYLLDEPQWRGASPADIATAARTIKQTYPSIPVMMVEAGPKVTDTLQVPANVDWVGFDWYCQSFPTIQAKLATLERRTTAAQKLFLMPEAAPLAECGGRPGHATDAEIARLQWQYFYLAVAHPRVIGLLAFGFWTSGHDSSDLPRTVAAHRQIAARIIPAPPPPAPAPSPSVPAPSGGPQRVDLPQRRVRVSRRGELSPIVHCPVAASVACRAHLALGARVRGKRRKAAGQELTALAPGASRRVRMRIRWPVRRTILRRAHRRAGARLTLSAATPAGTTTRTLVAHLARKR